MKQTIKAILFFAILTISSYVVGQTTFNYQNDFKTILVKTKDPKDGLSYDKLLKRFKINDTTLSDYEVLALLIGFTNNPHYKPYNDLKTEREVYALNGNNKYQEALDLGKKFSGTHPLSVKTLYEIGYAFHKLGQEDSAQYYVYQGRKIIHAMRFSGDGKTTDTPMFALGPIDGQVYISKSGAKIGIMGSGEDKNGNFIDILEAKLKDDQSVTLYFIIQHAMDKMFEGKSLKEALEEN